MRCHLESLNIVSACGRFVEAYHHARENQSALESGEEWDTLISFLKV